MARDARLDSDQLGLVCGFYRHCLGADARHCAFSSGSAQHVAECPDRVLADNRDFLCFFDVLASWICLVVAVELECVIVRCDYAALQYLDLVTGKHFVNEC